MENAIVQSSGTVLLVGGGSCEPASFQRHLASADVVVAADGGAQVVLEAGRVPDAVIGDFDSLPKDVLNALPESVVHHIAEQDSTDFDKCLRNIDAPLILGFGFLGLRMDHALAALTVLARRSDRRCILIGEDDILLLAPPEMALDLPVGSRFSLYPLGPVSGTSTGLEWPINGLRMQPNDRVGTSNRVTGPVTLGFNTPDMLLILPPEALDSVCQALASPETGWWPVRG